VLFLFWFLWARLQPSAPAVTAVRTVAEPVVPPRLVLVPPRLAVVPPRLAVVPPRLVLVPPLVVVPPLAPVVQA